jgi:hypothetical protein
MDSSSHKAIDQLKRINPPPTVSYAQRHINTQNSIFQQKESKLQTGLTLPTETNLPLFKPNGPTKVYNFSNVRTVFSPDRRLNSTSPNNKILTKPTTNFTVDNVNRVVKLGAGHKTQISFG